MKISALRYEPRAKRGKFSIPGWAGLALFTVVAIALGIALYGNRHRWNRADFDLYYSWWSEARRGIDPWSPPRNAVIASTPEQPVSGFCDNTPFLVVIFSPLAIFGEQTAYWLWMTTQMAALAGAVAVISGVHGPPRDYQTRDGYPGSRYIIALAGLALFIPHLIATIHGAQPVYIMLFLLTLSWSLDRTERAASSGALLAAATLLRAYPGAVGGYFLFRRRWRTLGWAIGFAVAGMLATGPGRWIEFFQSATKGHNYDQTRLVGVMSTVHQLMGKMLQGGELWPMVFTITALIDLAIVAIAAKVTIGGSDETDVAGLQFGIWMVVALLISPLTWDHELPLAIPAYWFALVGITAGRKTYRLGIAMLTMGVIVSWLAEFFVVLHAFHLYFIATSAMLVGSCALAATWSDRTKGFSPTAR